MLFKVLAIGKGYEPTFAEKVDPAKGPLDIRMDKFNRTALGPKSKITGRVLDFSGKPVTGAKVEPAAVQRGSSEQWGGLKGIDPLAITDEDGEFVITSREPFDALNVSVEARGLAPLRKNGLASDKEHTLVLTEGASVTGRVIQGGKPVGGVSLGMAGANRAAGEFAGYFNIDADAKGRFIFVTLPPNTEYFIYGIMSSLKDHGAIPANRIRVKGDGSVLDIGDVNVVPGLKLGGRVILSDGGRLPEATHVSVSLDEAWDLQSTEVDSSGRFEVHGLPPGPAISVSTRVNGYRLSPKNGSLDPWNPFHLMGRLATNKSDLLILLDPGPMLNPSRGGYFSIEDHPKELPLRGAEPSNRADEWILIGRVEDAGNQQPISSFEITPGRKDKRIPGGGVAWQAHRTEAHTNGEFTIVLSRRTNPPVLKAEAEGYLPAVSPQLQAGQTNYTFQLKKGHGPEGQVLLPSGKPAAGVSVFLVGPREQISLLTNAQIQAYGRPHSDVLTDPEGNFSFAPQLEGGAIFVANADGYGHSTVDALVRDRTIQLLPWGRIKGKLLKQGKPVKDETLSITFTGGFRPDQPWMNLQHRTRTDDHGGFEFDCVPPGGIQIITLIPISPGGFSRGWTSEIQQEVTVKPGETITVEVEKKERSPFPAFSFPGGGRDKP